MKRGELHDSTKRLQDLEGVIHSSEASGATPDECARAHPSEQLPLNLEKSIEPRISFESKPPNECPHSLRGRRSYTRQMRSRALVRSLSRKKKNKIAPPKLLFGSRAFERAPALLQSLEGYCRYPNNGVPQAIASKTHDHRVTKNHRQTNHFRPNKGPGPLRSSQSWPEVLTPIITRGVSGETPSRPSLRVSA
jgi:hypothetical protein